jgi:cobalt/nickel transport protein
MYRTTLFLTALLLLGLVTQARAHFGMLIPDAPAATAADKTIDLTLSFSHPFAGVGMELVKPERVGVVHDGEATELTGELAPAKVMDHPAWRLAHQPRRPGAYTFFMEPRPYWEPIEDAFIIHYTKVTVPAFGGAEGWDAPVGLPTEIVPMLRPFGNYAGNVFVGRVLRDGKPLPGAEVEVELFNEAGYEMPSEFHETQVVLADENGVFQFACPVPGWWGFAALSTADETMSAPDGSGEKAVELGAVFWTYMNAWSK